MKRIMIRYLSVFIVLVYQTTCPAQRSPSLLEAYLHLITVDGPSNARSEPPDRAVILKEYDFIIVGAGTAGCTLANRLSEVPEWKVLLIEAGREENFLMDVPILANFLQFGEINWKYMTEPSNSSCLGMKNNQCHWPRGKVVGGSSVLNYMIYTRGNKRDYNKWQELGNQGWGWDDVLPYFKRVESFNIPEYQDDRLHSKDGLLSVSKIPYKTKIADAFVDAGRQSGRPVGDYNGEIQTVFDYLQVTMNNGTRWSSTRAYLYPAKDRPNLHVKKMSKVTKIVIDKQTKQATGVEFVSRNRKYKVRASREVILSAGAINSPQLLMLSGIGPKKHLEGVGIRVLQDLKVGYNLQDHVSVGGLTYIIDQPNSIITQRILSDPNNFIDYFMYHQGPLTIPGGCEALAFYDLDNIHARDGHANLELLLVSGGLNSENTLMRNFNLKPDLYHGVYGKLGNRDTLMVLPMIMRPESRGRIKLRDKNPHTSPAIIPNYFTDPKGVDINVALKGIRLIHNVMMNSTAFKEMGIKRYRSMLPGCRQYRFDTDDYWKCFSRHMSFTIYHYSGTCKMGPRRDKDAVVDSRLRVHGIKNLRVIDASIMPLVVSAHTNGPTYMIAEKGSDMIKQDWGVTT